MFIRKPFVAPPGSTTSYEVKYPKGRKPFPTLPEAIVFAADQRDIPNGWSEINMIVSIPVQKRS